MVDTGHRGYLEIPLRLRDPNIVLVEDRASGQSLLQELGRETALPLKAIKPDKDKVTRANAVTLPDPLPIG